MTMSVNLIAILVSLAMMLTGAGNAGQPAEAAKVMTLHDVVLTYNGRTVELAPSLRLGASTDGEKAVFSLGAELNGETLLPIQLGADANGVTLLAEKSGISARVTSEAIESAVEQMMQPLQAMVDQAQAGGDDAAMMSVMMNDYIPAYYAMLGKLSDKEYMAELQQKTDAVFNQVVDRGEGVPVTEMVEGEEYALTSYTYTMDTDKLVDLIEALYASDPILSDYSGAMFKLFATMPEESGMQNITSFRDMFSKTGMKMSMDINEKRSDDGEVVLTNGTMTLDVSGMIAAAGEVGDMPEIPPMVFDIQAAQVGDNTDTIVTFNYAVDEASLSMLVHAVQSDMSMRADMSFSVMMEDQLMASISLTAYQDQAEDGGSSYFVNYNFNTGEAGTFDMSATGTCAADGTSENSFACVANTQGVSFSLSFECDVTAEPIEDKANGIEPTVTISDLSEEALNALGEDQAVTGALMQAAGSMQMDLQKLMQDPSVQSLMTLGQALEDGEEVEYNEDTSEDEAGDYDYTFEIEDDDEYEDVEDDGILGFEVPEFTWMPEGWSEVDRYEDTAFDWAAISLGNETGEDGLYASFYTDTESEQTNYVLDEKGNLTAVKGDTITINSFGEAGIVLTMRKGDLCVNISFYDPSISMETISQIVAGMKF